MIIAWLLMGGFTLSSIELPKKKQGKEKKKGNCHIPCRRQARSTHKLPFSDNNYWLILLTSGDGAFRLKISKSTFAIFFRILLKVKGVFYDRRIIKSQ